MSKPWACNLNPGMDGKSRAWQRNESNGHAKAIQTQPMREGVPIEQKVWGKDNRCPKTLAPQQYLPQFEESLK